MIYPIEWAYGSLVPRWGGPMRISQAKTISVSTVEQITVAEAAAHLRIDAEGSPLEYPENDQLEAFISAARDLCEGLSGLAIVPQVLEVALDQFPCGYSNWGWASGISLPVSPVRGIVSVTYPDGAGGRTTADPSAYVLNNYEMPSIIYPASDTTWPTLGTPSPTAVRVQFSAGYDLPGGSPPDFQLPAAIKNAMLLAIGHLYENREASAFQEPVEIPMGVPALLERYRIRTSMA